MSSGNQAPYKAMTIMMKKYPWVKLDTLAMSLREHELIASEYGFKEKGYARHASISDEHFHRLFPNAELECFSSPLNSHLPKFGSIGYVDSIYGSIGNIFNYHITEKVICAHPPNEAEIVKAFVDKVLVQEKQHDLTLYLFAPHWPDILDMLDASRTYIIAKEEFSLDRLAREKIMTNGNPQKHGQLWVPQKPRILITFLFPATITHEIDTSLPIIITSACKEAFITNLESLQEVSPFQEHVGECVDSLLPIEQGDYTTMSVLHKVRFEVNRICGIGSYNLMHRGDAIYHKLLTEFTGQNLSLLSSKISPKRIDLNELLFHTIPDLSRFALSDVTEQEAMIQHALSIAAGYHEIEESTQILKEVDAIYNQWCDHIVDIAALDSFSLQWYKFSQRVINAWLTDVCPLLESIPHHLVEYPVEISHYRTITINSDHSNINIDNVPCDILTSSNVNGVFFCTDTLCDRLHLDAIYSSYRQSFDNLVVISFELAVVNDIQTRFVDCATVISTFCGRSAYFTYLIVNTSSVDLSFPEKLIDTDDMLHVEIGTYYLGLAVESYSALELYRRMKDNRWLWKHNHLTTVFDSITKYMFEAHLGIKNRTILGARSLVIALQLISENSSVIQHALSFAIQHPLVRHCGGDGVDLYLNKLPHNTKNLMLMVEYTDTAPIMTDTLEMNMLDRKSVTIAQKDEVRHFECDSWVDHLPGAKATITKYRWVYPKNRFHSSSITESEKILCDIYFYERYVPNLKKFIIIQVLRSITLTGWLLELVHPHDMTRMWERSGSFNGDEFLTINALLSVCNFDRDPYSYFPNVHVDRRVNESPLGVDHKPLISILDGNEQLSEFMTDLIECHYERNEVDPTDASEIRMGDDSIWLGSGIAQFGLVSQILNTKFDSTNVLGWKPKVVNVVPRYYFDVLRELSNKEYTLMGDRIQYHTARLEIGEHTLFPCPGSNLVWNCKIGQILSGACIRSTRIKRLPVIQPGDNNRHRQRNHRSYKK